MGERAPGTATWRLPYRHDVGGHHRDAARRRGAGPDQPRWAVLSFRTAIDCHSLGNHVLILLSLSVKMTAPPVARRDLGGLHRPRAREQHAAGADGELRGAAVHSLNMLCCMVY